MAWVFAAVGIIPSLGSFFPGIRDTTHDLFFRYNPLLGIRDSFYLPAGKGHSLDWFKNKQKLMGVALRRDKA